MLLGVISDTHIPNRVAALPKQIFAHFKSVDLILHAGDITDYAVIEELEYLAPVKAVMGNMDGPDIQIRYPEKQIIKVKNFTIGLMHGIGAKSTVIQRVFNAFKGEDVDCIVFGHTHQPFQQLLDNILVFNPGSPTDKRGNKFYSFGLIELKRTYIQAKIIYF